MGKGSGCRQRKEEMNVIGRSTRGDKREALAPRNAAQVGIEFSRTGGRNERAAIFGAEDTMNKIARVRMRHDAPSLQDSQFTIALPHPTLKRGANNRCAYGADS